MVSSLGSVLGAFAALFLLKDFKKGLKFFAVVFMIANLIYFHNCRLLDILFVVLTVVLKTLVGKKNKNLKKSVIFLGIFAYIQF